jgi:formylmethanofuran dehydrogenase subunit E-like metal-binding protein
VWIFLWAKASLSGDNAAPNGHPVFISTNGNKKKGTVHVMTSNNLAFMSKCLSKTEGVKAISQHFFVISTNPRKVS